MTSQTAQTETTTQPIEKVASGRELIIYSILAYFLTVVIQAVLVTTFRESDNDIVVLVTHLVPLGGIVVCIIMSLVGIFRLASGLGYSTGEKIVTIQQDI